MNLISYLIISFFLLSLCFPGVKKPSLWRQETRIKEKNLCFQCTRKTYNAINIRYKKLNKEIKEWEIFGDPSPNVLYSTTSCQFAIHFGAITCVKAWQRKILFNIDQRIWFNVVFFVENTTYLIVDFPNGRMNRTINNNK